MSIRRSFIVTSKSICRRVTVLCVSLCLALSLERESKLEQVSMVDQLRLKRGLSEIDEVD